MKRTIVVGEVAVDAQRSWDADVPTAMKMQIQMPRSSRNSFAGEEVVLGVRSEADDVNRNALRTPQSAQLGYARSVDLPPIGGFRPAAPAPKMAMPNLGDSEEVTPSWCGSESASFSVTEQDSEPKRQHEGHEPALPGFMQMLGPSVVPAVEAASLSFRAASPRRRRHAAQHGGRDLGAQCSEFSARRDCFDELTGRMFVQHSGPVQTVVEVGNRCGWRVVISEELVAPNPVGASANHAATVVVLDIRCGAGGAELVRRQMSGDSQSPLVAALVCTEDSCGDELLLEVQREMLASGADDVVLLEKSCNPERCVRMGVAKAQHRCRVLRDFEAHVIAECKQEFKQQIEELERQVQEPKDDMFWESAHKVFSGFPQIDYSLEASPKVGTMLGACKLERKIGQGGFGIVYLGVHSDTAEREAVKVLEKASIQNLDEARSVWREIYLLKSFDHPNIVRLLKACHSASHIMIFMEYVGKANLKKAIAEAGGRFEIHNARKLFAQMMSAIAHIHSHSVAHRDIKPENIAVTRERGSIKLLDFGSSASLAKPCRDMAGTMPFMAPEILFARDCESYTPSGCDVWAVAVVLLEMLSGFGKLDRMLKWGTTSKRPEEYAADLHIYFQDFDDMYTSLMNDLGEVEDSLMDLFAGMFQLEVAHRLRAHQVEQSEWLEAHR